MNADLGLSPDQENRMAEARKSFKAKRDALKNDNTLSKDLAIEKLDTLRSEHQAAVKSILTEEQFTKWKEHKARMKSKKYKR
jgi:hypothetical protein